MVWRVICVSELLASPASCGRALWRSCGNVDCVILYSGLGGDCYFYSKIVEGFRDGAGVVGLYKKDMGSELSIIIIESRNDKQLSINMFTT